MKRQHSSRLLQAKLSLTIGSRSCALSAKILRYVLLENCLLSYNFRSLKIQFSGRPLTKWTLQQAAGSENEPPMAQYALAAIDSVVRFTDAGFELISSLVKPSDVIMFITE